jgi:serine phosphatase RsbU (regulator of sigma subunit)
VRDNMSLTPYQMCTALYASMRDFIGATPQVDDTTFLAIKRMERGPAAAVSAGAGAGIL